MVGAMFTHLTCLRRMKDDEGWIRTLLEEAENERMHLMTFIEIAKPTFSSGSSSCSRSGSSSSCSSLLYLVSSRTAHRVVGYFEEEAVISYTLYLKEIDEGRSPNVPAPGDRQALLEDAGRRDAARCRAAGARRRSPPPRRQSRLCEQAGRWPANPLLAAPYPAHATDVRPNL